MLQKTRKNISANRVSPQSKTKKITINYDGFSTTKNIPHIPLGKN